MRKRAIQPSRTRKTFLIFPIIQLHWYLQNHQTPKKPKNKVKNLHCRTQTQLDQKEKQKQKTQPHLKWLDCVPIGVKFYFFSQTRCHPLTLFRIQNLNCHRRKHLFDNKRTISSRSRLAKKSLKLRI